MIGMILPLWFPIDINKIRQNRLWKFYLWITFFFMIVGISLEVRVDTGIFFLIMFCLIYEFYGEQRLNTPNRLISILSFLIIAYQARKYLGMKQLYVIVGYASAVLTTLIGLYHLNLYRGQSKKDLFKAHAVSYLHLIPILSIAVLFFWLAPRARGSSAGIESNETGQQISGFSGRVRLSDIGILKNSDRPVLDLTILQGEPAEPYLIGRYLHIYENEEWQTYARTRTVYGADARFHQEDLFGGEVRYRIHAEPFQGNTVFFLRNPIRIEEFENYLDIEGFSDNISMSKKTPNSLNYTGVSGLSPRQDIKISFMRRYLQIPDRHDYLRTTTNEILGDGEWDNQQKAILIRRHLIQNYKYTLAINNFDAQDPIREFLIERKEGHCELFASSATLMLRTANVPTRLVTGFLLDQAAYNGQFYHVQEKMAHAWLEYYHEGQWHTLDPTPSLPISRPTLFQSGTTNLRYLWRSYFTSFDYFSQKDNLELVVESYLENRVTYNRMVIGLILIATIIFLVKRNIHLLRMKRQDKVQLSLIRIEKLLCKHFDERHPQEKFSDFVRRLDLSPILEQKIERYSHEVFAYCYSRGGREQQAGKLIKEGRTLLRTLKQEVG
ncbi:transglutaminase domain-containing protein [Acanthopleuribacter pedis]|uniref:Transglutaminase domain-containing protein n=2 Tax=Acanthopleuribacter pedis TaxID=442870 RepID=A0A8J7U328_9BACT|nr:transglutaminase domain-containing protein [Acanthopleuribacter pedis]